MRPLYEALKGKAPIQEIDWSAEAEVAFKEVKTALAQAALLAHPSSTAPHLHYHRRIRLRRRCMSSGWRVPGNHSPSSAAS